MLKSYSQVPQHANHIGRKPDINSACLSMGYIKCGLFTVKRDRVGKGDWAITKFALSWINEICRRAFSDVVASAVTITDCRARENATTNTRAMLRALVIIVAFIAAGPESQTQQPDFLARNREDCNNGDQVACAMLDVLSKLALRTEPSDAADRRQVQRDVGAIMEGIDKARSSQPKNRMHLAPTAFPSSKPVRP